MKPRPTPRRLLIVFIGAVVPVYLLVWLLGEVEDLTNGRSATALSVHLVVFCLGFAGVWLAVNDVQGNPDLAERQRTAWICAMAVALPVAAVVYLVRFTRRASKLEP